jgi:hypothetical protein
VSSRDRTWGTWLACLLTLTVAGLCLPNSLPGETPPGPGHMARAVELIVPGLYAPLSGVADGRSLVSRSLLGDNAGPWDPSIRLHVGLTPLALALLGLAIGRGAWALSARLALALAVLLSTGLVAVPTGWSVPVGQGALAVLAGCGLLSLLQRRSERAEMLLAVGCLVLTAGLVSVALSTGAATDREALAPLLERWPGDGTAPGPASLAASALNLRRALDASALASFACLSVLLGLLRWRGVFTALLVVAVSAAELLALSGR